MTDPYPTDEFGRPIPGIVLEFEELFKKRAKAKQELTKSEQRKLDLIDRLLSSRNDYDSFADNEDNDNL